MMAIVRSNKFLYDAMEQNSEKTNLFTSFPQSCKEAIHRDRWDWRQVADRAWPAEKCQIRDFMEIMRAFEIKLAAMMTIR